MNNTYTTPTTFVKPQAGNYTRVSLRLVKPKAGAPTFSEVKSRMRRPLVQDPATPASAFASPQTTPNGALRFVNEKLGFKRGDFGFSSR